MFLLSYIQSSAIARSNNRDYGPPEPFFGGSFPGWVLLIQGIIALLRGIFLLTAPSPDRAGPYHLPWCVLVRLAASSPFFSAAGDTANRGMKILLGIPGIIPGLAILAYPIYALLLPFIFIILVGVWPLILGKIHPY